MKQKKKKSEQKPSSQGKKNQPVSGSLINNPKYQKALWVLAIGVPAFVIFSFFNSLYKNSINFPFFDDHEAILNFLTRFITHPDLKERIKLIFEQHSEHRLAFDRMVALAEYYLFPQINFISFIIIGHLALVVALFIFFKSFQLKEKLHPVYLLPLAAVILNFKYFETSFWPMAALQNLWVLSFALTSFYFLYHNGKYSFYLSILFGWIAAFTSANGMMIFIAGSFVLFINKNLLNKQKLIWLGCGLLAVAAYFYHYHKPPVHPPIIEPMMADPMGFLGYIFAFLGGNFTDDITNAVVIGASLVAFALFLTYKKYYQENPIIYSFIIFLLITGTLAALTRFGFGLGQALSSKYAINSALLTACCYIGLVSLVLKRIKLIYILAVTAFALYFHFDTYKKYLPAKKTEKEEFDKNYALVTQGKLSYFNFGWPPLDDRKEEPRRELRAADSLGYFHFKFREEKDILNDIPSVTDKEIKFKLERFERTQVNAIVMQGYAYIKGVSSDDMMTVLCLKDEQGNPVKYFVCQKYVRQDITQANKADNANYNMSGFFTFYNPKEVKPGKYMLAIIITNQQYKVEFNTGQMLNMQ